jgi:hypothetical protein
LKWGDPADPGRVMTDLPGNLRSAAAVHSDITVRLSPKMALHLARTVERGGWQGTLEEQADVVAGHLAARLQQMAEARAAEFDELRASAARERRRLWLLLGASGVFAVIGWAGLIIRAVTA